MKKIKIEDFGNYLVILAVILMALKLPILGTIIFMLTNISFILFGIKNKKRSFIITNCILFVINIFGICNWLFF